MRRLTSLFMIAALLSVTSLPLLPQAAVCHAAESNAECDTCHPQEAHTNAASELLNDSSNDLHAHMMHGPGMEMQRSMEHNSHHDGHGAMQHRDASEHEHHNNGGHDHQNIEQPGEMHKHQKQLSAAEQACRIECGCGCNRSLDGFPHLLSPHALSTIHIESGERIVRIEPETFPALQSVTATVPPPPPKHA